MKFKVRWLKRLLAVGLSLAMLTGTQGAIIPGMGGGNVNVVYASEEVTDEVTDEVTEVSTVSGNDGGVQVIIEEGIEEDTKEATVSGNDEVTDEITDEETEVSTVSGNDEEIEEVIEEETEELTVSGNDLGARALSTGTYFAQNDPDGAVEAAVRNGTILQVFCWNFETMIENMDDIAAAGYTAIQTSPINECIDTNPALTLSGSGMWYYHYQPTDWVIGNYQLGTRDQFKAMCAEADEYGIKVIVDILPNHTTATRSEVTQNLINSAGGTLDDLYHETGLTNMQNYSDRLECTYYAMGGLPDVDTEDVGFQNYFFTYLQDCIACGADGFRIDTAKHIALPDDPTPEGSDVENNFYPNMYNAVTSKNDLFVYGEVLQGANERLGAYQDAIGGTTASSYGGSIRSALVNNDYSVSKIQGYQIAADATPSKLVTWVESHDNYINDGTAALLDEEQVKLGWAIITAREEGTPLFFSRPMGSSKENMWGENKIGIAGSDIYKDDEVVAVNKFRTAMAGESENLRNPNNNSQIIMIERGTKGVTIVNGSYSNYTLDSATNLADGTYINMTDDNSVFTVTNGVINGVLPARSVVVLYEKATTEMTTVLFYNSKMWGNVSASVNDSTELIAATNDGDGWWRVTVEANVAEGFTIVFTNGTDKSDKFTINSTSGRYATGENATVYNSKNAAEDALEIVKTSVYLLNSAVWDTVSAYAWIGENKLLGEWPGVSAVYEGDYWWKIDIPASPSEELCLIFNNNGAGEQTADIAITNGNDVYLTNTTTEKYASKEAAEEAAGVSSNLTTVYYYNSSAWENVYTYTWGNNEDLGKWPGEAAEPIGNGWWKKVIPTGASSELNVIFNNGKLDGDSNKQQATGAVVSNIRDVYLTFSGSKYASIQAAEEALGLSNTETKVYYYDTDKWDATYAYAKSKSTGEEYLNEWPGTEMTEDYNGWKYITIPSGASDDLEVTFSNGNEEDGNTVVVNDRSKIYFTGKDSTAYASKIAAETVLGVPLSATTVYFYNCDEWENVSVWAWAGDVNYTGGSWPGKAATDEGNGWWSYQVPVVVSGADNFSIIFNNGNNGSQSKDITITDANKVYITNGTADTFASMKEVEAYIEALRSSIDVYYYDTNDWTTTYVYAKSMKNGTEYLGAWPGKAMTADDNGWQVVTIGAAASDDLEVTFSDGTGTKEDGQTFIVNDRTKLYLTGESDVAYASKNEAETALGVELSTTTVYFYNSSNWATVNVWAWDSVNNYTGGVWPGVAATKEGDSDWWKFSISATASSELKVIFSNGAGAQTADLSVDNANKLYFAANNQAYSSKEEAEAAINAIPDETVVYYYNSDNWPAVSAHAWTDAAALTNWPGIAATDEGDGWWKVAIPSKPASDLKVIFNNGGNGSQIGDFVVSDANKVYATNATTVLFASKEQAEEVYVALQGETDVYFYNGGDWDSVNAYAWIDDIKVLGEWPGAAATDEGDGWWKITIPAGAHSGLNVIFNGSGGQTGNLSLADSEKTYATHVGTTMYSSKEEAEAVLNGEGNTITVHFYNGAGWSNVNAHSWTGSGGTTWPGVPATDEGDGWWSITLEPASDLGVIFNDGNGSQTANLYVTDVEKLYVTNASTTFYSSKEEAMKALGAIPDETVVYFYNSDNWPAVNAHYWTDSGAFTNWPGTAATDEGNGWWKVTLNTKPASDLKVIFNNNGAGSQTGDYVISDASKIYATNATTVLFTSKAKAEEVYEVLQGETAVYFYNGGNWDSVNAYAWIDDIKVLGEWPGTAATDEGDGWWKITIPARAYSGLNVIFNGSGGQTSDLSLAESDKAYVADEKFYSSKEEAENAVNGESGNTGNNGNTGNSGNTGNTGNSGNTESNNNNAGTNTNTNTTPVTPVPEENIIQEETMVTEPTTITVAPVEEVETEAVEPVIVTPPGVELSEEKVAEKVEELTRLIETLNINETQDATEATETTEKPTIVLDMKNENDEPATMVPVEVLEVIKGHDVDVVLDMGGYSWTINGSDIKATQLATINLEVKVNTDAIPSNLVSALAGDKPTTQISLTHEGDFGFTASLTVNVGAENAGQYGNMYYYDSDNRLVFMNAGQIDEDGNVNLSFSHASDYVVVVGEEVVAEEGTIYVESDGKLVASAENITGETEQIADAGEVEDISDITVVEEADVNNSGVVIAIIVILLLALAITIFINVRKNKEK